MSKKTLIFLSLLLLVGCSMNSRLDHIAGLIDEHPSEALALLDSISQPQLGSPRLRARYALLRSAALNKNYITADSDSIIAPAVMWYIQHGTPEEKGAMHYYYGWVLYDMERFDGAAVAFTEARNNLERSSDLFLKGLSTRMLAVTNNKTYNSSDNLPLLEEARALFVECGKERYVYDTDLLIAQHYNNTLDYEKADSVYTSLEQRMEGDTLLLSNCWKQHARLLANGLEDYPRSYALFNQAIQAGAKLSSEDWLAYAVACYDAGEKGIAKEVIRQVDDLGGSEAQVYNTLYRINVKEGNYLEALENQEKAYSLQDSVVLASMKQSSIKAQRDYYEETSARLNERTKYQRTVLLLLLAVFILSLVSFFFFLSRRKAKYQEELTRLAEIASQTEALLNETAAEKDSFKARYIQKFKGQFALLQHIAETSLTAKKRTDSQEYLLKKLAELEKLVSDDSQGNAAFEQMLNTELDGIMKHIRADYPGKREKTYRLISYLFAGFDATAISMMLGYSTPSIYVRKSQIIEDIKKIESPYKQQYLDFLCN